MSSPGSKLVITGWPAAVACPVACWLGDASQHPMWPHCAHRRRLNHQPGPSPARHSTQPSPDGGTDGSIPEVVVIRGL